MNCNQSLVAERLTSTLQRCDRLQRIGITSSGAPIAATRQSDLGNHTIVDTRH